jgi:hypothetical protein
MTIRAPHSPGFESLNLRPPEGAADNSIGQRGIAGVGLERPRGTGTQAPDGEAVLAMNAWEGADSRSLALAGSGPTAYASGPDMAQNIERDVDYILSAFA